MKFKSLAAACALAFAGQAFAVTPATTPDVQLFISGSSALQNAIGQIATDIFVAGTIDEMWDGAVTAATGTTAATAVPNGSSYRAYFGTVKTGATTSAITIPASLAGKNVLIYNTGAGGSIKGVNPVALATPVNRLDITTCVLSAPVVADAITGATNVYTCPGVIATAVPDAGVSDVEPSLLTGINLTISAATALTTRTATATALTPAQLANLTVKSALGQPMGVIVTANAPVGLQSLSKAQVESLMDGKYNVYDWNQIDSTIVAGTTSIVVCRRQQGSGTQASINASIFGFPCSSSQLYPATAQAVNAATVPATPISLAATTTPAALPAGSYVVIENSSSGVLAACMTNVQNGTAAGKAIDVTTGAIVAAGSANSVVLPAGGYGIGLMGFDRPAKTGETYVFAAINGAAATLANAVTGAYDIMVENAFTRRTNATVAGTGATLPVAAGTSIPALTGAQLDLWTTFVTSAGNPATLGTAGHIVPGVAALSENGNIAPATFTAATPVMRVGNGGNTCTPLYMFQ
jgi:hypothetical protein